MDRRRHRARRLQMPRLVIEEDVRPQDTENFPLINTAEEKGIIGHDAPAFAGIEKGYFQIEKLTNLDLLPSTGFKFYCFPVKIKGASAGWIRAVAEIE